MRSTKKLSLKREVLTELSTDDLAAVAGGGAGVNVNTPVCNTTYTATCNCTDNCPSDNYQCASLDTCTCDCTYRTICGCYVL